ncbi:MAG: 2-phosphosulfolactate phosphatase [Chloroflexi bacterium]|nr:2-phosphosulfolactate phosphatase [Chloroflexota bacterium]
MRIDVAPRAAALAAYDLSRWRVVVMDAVRASTTVAHAIATGAEAVIPMATVEEARSCHARLVAEAKQTGRPAPLLAGERLGLPLPGFDLGNSPSEFTPERVKGRVIVLTTTNGAVAMAHAAKARETIVGAFANLPAVVRYLVRHGGDVLLVAAGREDAPVLDDTVCAGMYAAKLAEAVPGAELTDMAHVTRLLYQSWAGRIEEALRVSASGQALIRQGLGADLPACAAVGSCEAVPMLHGGEIRAAV